MLNFILLILWLSMVFHSGALHSNGDNIGAIISLVQSLTVFVMLVSNVICGKIEELKINKKGN